MARPKRICTIEDCGRDHYGRGYCRPHYQRWYITGDPKPDMPIVPWHPHVTQHGTMNEYNNYGCRCDLCRAAGVQWQREYRERPCINGCGRMVWGNDKRTGLCVPCLAESRTIPLEERHGTELGYKKGCRCDQCRQAASDSRRRRRHAAPEHERLYQREYKRKKRAALRAGSPDAS